MDTVVARARSSFSSHSSGVGTAARAIECVPPREAAARILGAIFPEELSALEDRGEPGGTLSSFQRRGVARALATIDRYNGVVIADAVGLGKTHMGLAVARHFVTADASVVAVVPSALRRQWESPLRKLGGRVTIVTHAALSRGAYRASLSSEHGLLLVDEAHAFRNPGTRRYGALARLALNRSVCLITATPVNNSLWDLYHLVRLFCTDDALASIGVPDLRAAFADAAADGGAPGAGSGAGELRTILRALVIRRTRRDVADEVGHADARFRFPALQPPMTIAYDPAVDAGHDEILRGIADLKLDAFGSDASALIRFLLLKRLASSSTALCSTVRGLLHLQHERLAALREGLLLTPADTRIASLAVDQLSMRRLVCVPVPPFMDVKRVEADARHDLEILADIERHASRTSHDPKLDQLRLLLDGRLRDEKVLIFTEFRDTAEYLWRALLPRGGVGLIHGSDAFLGRGRAGRSAVVTRFAPRVNGNRRFPDREAVNILIATDVLSEGLNLQDCAHVVSYDLPWNPVRLIQRVGRIDRMGSPHAEVHSYNFVPDRTLDAYLLLLQRLGIKLRAIDTAVGLEHIVVAPRDTDMTAWRHLLTHRSACMQSDWTASTTQPGGEATDEAFRAWLRTAGAAGSDAPCVTVIGGRSRSTAPRNATDAIVMIGCNRSVRAFRDRRKSTDCELEEIDPLTVAAACIDAADVEGTHAVSRDVSPVLIRKAGRLFERAIDRVGRVPFSDSAGFPCRSAPIAAPVHPAAVRVARRIQTALSAIPGGPDPQQAALAETLITALGRSPPAALELEIRTLERRKGMSLDEIAAAARPILEHQPGDRGSLDAPEEGRRWRLICAVFTTSAVDPPPARR